MYKGEDLVLPNTLDWQASLHSIKISPWLSNDYCHLNGRQPSCAVTLVGVNQDTVPHSNHSNCNMLTAGDGWGGKQGNEDYLLATMQLHLTFTDRAPLSFHPGTLAWIRCQISFSFAMYDNSLTSEKTVPQVNRLINCTWKWDCLN